MTATVTAGENFTAQHNDDEDGVSEGDGCRREPIVEDIAAVQDPEGA